MRFEHPEDLAFWPAPNYINPETRGPTVFIVNSLFFLLASIALSVRLYARIFVRKWFGLDDFLVVIAFLCNIGDLTTVFWGNISYGWGRHMWDEKVEWLNPGSKLLFATKILWSTSSTFIRLSLLCLYYRLLNHVQMRQYRWVLHVVTFFVVGIYLSYLGTGIWACVPIDAYFLWPSPGSCINEGTSLTALSALNTFSEFLVALLPIPVIWQLQMGPTKSLSVICLLSLGVFVGAVGSVRTYYVWYLFSSSDMTWWSTPQWICSEVEICVGLICACAPAIRPVVGRALSSKPPNQPNHESDDLFDSTTTDGKGSPTFICTGGTKFDEKFIKTTTSRDYSVRGPSVELSYRPIDIEGIGLDDGYGYTVEITSGSTAARKKKAFRMKRRDEESCNQSKSREADDEKPSLWGDLAVAWNLRPRPANPSIERVDYHISAPRMQVVTRNSFEIQESFRDLKLKLSPEMSSESSRMDAAARDVDAIAMAPRIWSRGSSSHGGVGEKPIFLEEIVR